VVTRIITGEYTPGQKFTGPAEHRIIGSSISMGRQPGNRAFPAVIMRGVGRCLRVDGAKIIKFIPHGMWAEDFGAIVLPKILSDC